MISIAVANFTIDTVLFSSEIWFLYNRMCQWRLVW